MRSENKLKNWAGNLDYSTDRLYSANSVEEVRNYVKKQSQLKVLGTRHCFNNIADSRHSFLSLKPMDEVVALDPAAHTVTVNAGMTYGQLCPYLHSKGFAVHNLASLPHISIAGACSTATHGSGEKNGNLATAVSALEIVTAAGDIVKLSRQQDGEAFRGAVVGLGAVGVVTKVTLDIQPTFMMRQYVYENLPLAAVKDHFDAIEASAYSVSLFTDWQNQRFSEVWIKSRDEAGQAFDAIPEFFGATLATKNLHPIVELSAENCTEQMGVPGPWFERLPHFRMGFTPSAGKELQSEYFVPRQHAVEAILAVERLRDQVTPHLLITEIRAIARGRSMVESLLRTSLRHHSLHLETRLARGQVSVTRNRERTGSIQGPATLGKTVYHGPRRAEICLHEVARLHSTLQEVRPARQIPK